MSFELGEMKEKKAKNGSRRQLNWSTVEEEGWNARWGLGCALVGLQRCSSLWELVEDSRTSTTGGAGGGGRAMTFPFRAVVEWGDCYS